MEGTADSSSVISAPCGGGKATWGGWLLWLPTCLAFALLVGWGAFTASQVRAPLVVFPVLVGVLLGASIVAMARMFQIGHRATVWAAAILAVAVAVVGQHYFSYRAAIAQDDAARESIARAQVKGAELVQAMLPPPASGPFDYMRRQAAEGRPLVTYFGSYTATGAMAWLCWAIDGLLVLAPVVVMVSLALRRPYCRQCGSWYSTRRRGRVDAEAVQQLAAVLDLSPPTPSGEGYFRLIGCNQGCVPAGFSLILGGSSAGQHSETIWLDDERRRRVVEILDEARR